MSRPVTPNGPILPEPAPARGRDSIFGRSLRYEIAGDEGRALLGSYIFSFALAIAWLGVVYFGPKTMPMRLLSRDEQPIAVTFDPVEPALDALAGGEDTEAVRVPAPGPVNPAPVPRGDRSGKARQPTTASAGAIADAFGTSSGNGSGGMVGDVSNVLRNVDVSSGAGGTGAGANATGGAARGAKVVLGAGEGGEGSRTPGRGGIAGTIAAAGGEGEALAASDPVVERSRARRSVSCRHARSTRPRWAVCSAMSASWARSCAAASLNCASATTNTA